MSILQKVNTSWLKKLVDMKKLMMFLGCLLLSLGVASAQNQKVSGVVLSEEDGLPVIGAAVTVEGTSLGTITDFDGFFNITNVPATATKLKVSYLGMKSQTVTITPNMKITLVSDAEVLDEVIVTGYGTF